MHTHSSTQKQCTQKQCTQKQCALTIDVEDYYHVAAFDKQIARKEWGKKYPSRVKSNTEKILEMLHEHNVKATFFMLGWVAQTCPALARKITEHGHELASHGHLHQKASSQSMSAFKEDVYQSKALLEDITGEPILGYRAPSFSINPTNEWAFQVLAELGFAYSSSTYPIKHDQYGAPTWPKSSYTRPEGIIEIPIPTLQIMGKNIPIGGGGFFRLYPYSLSKLLIQKYLNQTGLAYSFYFHPWEIDTKQPKIKNACVKSTFRHYLNLAQMESRLCHLLSDFSWNTMKNVYQITELKNHAKYSNKKNDTSRHASLGLLYR